MLLSPSLPPRVGNAMAVPGFRCHLPYGLKKDDQLPELNDR